MWSWTKLVGTPLSPSKGSSRRRADHFGDITFAEVASIMKLEDSVFHTGPYIHYPFH